MNKGAVKNGIYISIISQPPFSLYVRQKHFCRLCERRHAGAAFMSGGDVLFFRRFFLAFFIKGEKFFDPL